MSCAAGQQGGGRPSGADPHAPEASTNLKVAFRSLDRMGLAAACRWPLERSWNTGRLISLMMRRHLAWNSPAETCLATWPSAWSRSRDLEDERAFGRDAGRIVAQRKPALVGGQHCPQAIESRTEALVEQHARGRSRVVEFAASADLIVCCVDNAEAREVLDHLAYASCLPLIDGGFSWSRETVCSPRNGASTWSAPTCNASAAAVSAPAARPLISRHSRAESLL